MGCCLPPLPRDSFTGGSSHPPLTDFHPQHRRHTAFREAGGSDGVASPTSMGPARCRRIAGALRCLVLLLVDDPSDV